MTEPNTDQPMASLPSHPIFISQEQFTPQDILDYVRQPGVRYVSEDLQDGLFQLQQGSVASVDGLVRQYGLSLAQDVTDGHQRVALYTVAEEYHQRATELLQGRPSEDGTKKRLGLF